MQGQDLSARDYCHFSFRLQIINSKIFKKMSARGQDAANKDNETNLVYKSKYCCPFMLINLPVQSS